jgi:hypothetical protein
MCCAIYSGHEARVFQTGAPDISGEIRLGWVGRSLGDARRALSALDFIGNLIDLARNRSATHGEHACSRHGG